MTEESRRNQLTTCPVAFAARRDGSATAVVHTSGSITFDELDRRVSRLCVGLRDGGVEPGNNTALAAENSPELLCVILALVRLGAIAVMLPIRYPVDALEGIASRTRCKTALVDRPDRLPADFHSPLLPLWDLGVSPSGEPSDPTLYPDRPAVIVCTSGSTGEPRPVVLSWRSLYHNALGANRNMTLAPGDRWLLSLPLYHVGGLGVVFRCLLAGATVVIPRDPRDLAREVAKSRASHLSLVPTQLRRLLAELKNLGSVREVLVGGGPIPATLLEQARRSVATIRTTYGLTEMASQVTTTSGADLKDHTSGTVLPYRSVRIGEDDEILVRGETLFSGYLMDGRPVLPLDEQGWYHTGDRGSFDGGGRLTVLGRLDNMFVSGGENIFPEEIERILDNVEGILSSVVVDVPDEEYGARPVAFVEYESGPMAAEDIREALGQLLPRFKLPVGIFTLPVYPAVGLDKIDRQELKRIAYTRLRDNDLSHPTSHR